MTNDITERPKRPTGISVQLEKALRMMVWEGVEYTEAARSCQIPVRSMRRYLTRPHALAFLRAERSALLASEGPRTVKRLVELRDQDRHVMGAVTAGKTLLQLADEVERQPSVGVPRVPGLVIMISGAAVVPDSPAVTIDHGHADHLPTFEEEK